MHSIETIRQIDRLLRQGEMSQREIAAYLGVSRSTVGSIARGRRGLHGKLSDDATRWSRRPPGAPVRCPKCGYRIYRPCLVCSTRDYRQQEKLKIVAARGDNADDPSQ